MTTPRGQVVITTDAEVTSLVGPYNAGLPAKARLIGGRWDAGTKSWRFDARDEQRVRALAQSIYGTDGAGDLDDVVTVRIAGDYGHPSGVTGRTITVCGRIVAERRARDDAVHLAPGVVLMAGGFDPSGGSARKPAIGPNDAVLEVRDIPRSAALAAGLTPVGEDRREALLTERARLEVRLAEIDKELGR